ncbi:MAG: hypothetical protein PVI44_13370 [Balneolaceae bacterium]|jgi:hypothetical protein
MKRFKYYCPMLLLPLLCIWAFSCSIFGGGGGGEPSPGVEGIYEGIYTQGFEDSSFQPCLVKDEVWKLVEIEDSTFFSGLQKVGENPVYMKLKGIPSEKGGFLGFFVKYDREFSVQKVLRVASSNTINCL